MAAWIKPAGNRRRLINGMLQLNANFIFCFRAKEKTKPVKGGGIQELGWMPIAGDEMLFEMTLNCLLPPQAKGVPQWTSDQVGEKMMMKLPRQFEKLFADGRALDEAHGTALAEWAKGSKTGRGHPGSEPKDEAPAPAPKKNRTAAEWQIEATAEVMACKTQKDVIAWQNANATKIDRLVRYNADLATQLQDLINEKLDSFNVLAGG